MPCIRKLEGLRMLHMTVRYDRASDALVYDRKLQDGPGDSMYGLEVCKALALPDDFLQLAHDIRRRRVPTKRCVLGAPTSRYNAKKVKGNCEECGAQGVDTHHLQPQEEADVNGLIGHFHKNHVANLIVLCKECHAQKTSTKLKEKRVKTSRGKRIAKVDGGK
jgi:DNA mismatch repair protein MutS